MNNQQAGANLLLPLYLYQPEELELVFTQIDPKEPSRPFGLAVKVHDDKTYEGAQIGT